MQKPTYYECGVCGAMHHIEWSGDCREDAVRFDIKDLDARHGSDGWNWIPEQDIDEFLDARAAEPSSRKS